MAKIKVNHFASKTIPAGTTVTWESLLTEALITFLLIVFSSVGYHSKLANLFTFCGLAALVCAFSFLHSLYITML